MTISVASGATAFLLLECLHTQGVRAGINATEVQCIKCGQLRKCVRVVPSEWRLECDAHKPKWRRTETTAITSVRAARRHTTRFPEHTVRIIEPTGELWKTVAKAEPTLYVDSETGAPY